MTPSRSSVRTWMLATFIVFVVLIGTFIAVRNTVKVQALTKQNHALALQGIALGQEIQAQRRESLLDDCRNDNRKYDTTIATLRTFGIVPPRVATLIGDIVPHHANCTTVVHAKAPAK